MNSGGDGICVRRILNVSDLPNWYKSEGYKDLMSFIRQLNDFAKGVHNGLCDESSIKETSLQRVRDLLCELSKLADQIEPIKGDTGQRFGNKAFRTWYDGMKTKAISLLQANYSEKDQAELRPYLLESFGNQQRIDYGTGHELCFVIFMLGLYKLELIKEGDTKERMKSVSIEILTLFAVKYMPLVRKIQTRYQLEPAGSHGVYSLDDFQFLAFLFGSSQLVAHPLLEPKSFPDSKIAEEYAPKYMFFAAIHFIHQVKKGPFHEHSNQLWNISGVENWSKINRGLLKMYTDEVLHKFPVVQHLVFGPQILKWNPTT
ncbi:serine/threonine-protein phosphatase 2A activator-like [Brevipalpus obovatus]|uniref:serine/threonine-protein phosphatase 2A activator-like n=1 Tax=Brevipalpus obovatus TaxID=246614 RepID=UPI003D9E1E9F